MPKKIKSSTAKSVAMLFDLSPVCDGATYDIGSYKYEYL